MNDVERYLFDLQGFLVIDNVLSVEELDELNRVIDEQNYPPPNGEDVFTQRFYDFLEWESDVFRKLLTHPRVIPYLPELIGDTFRLDHEYGILMQRGNPAGTLHGGGTPYDPAQYYIYRNEKMYNGLTVVSWALTDMLPGQGGFCCIPGSHKSNITCPENFRSVVDDPPCLAGVHQKAGDVLIFTEALTHGTLPWHAEHQRRSILFKYIPGHASWGQPRSDDSLLKKMGSEEQRRMLEPPYVAERRTVLPRN